MYLKFVAVVVVCLMNFIPSAQSQVVDSVEAMVDRVGHYLLYRNHDTTYISNFGNEIGVKLLAMNKYNYFSVWDRENDSRIRYRPFRDLYLGIGFAYKWIAADFTFSTGIDTQDDLENQRSFDFQGRVFSSKHFFAATVQYYQGYKINGLDGVDYTVPDTVEFRDDFRTTNIELQYLYAFNYTKFSIKAPFVLNEVQKKSAGSPIMGASFSTFNLHADSSIIPTDIEDQFMPSAQMTDFNMLSLGISFGYMYTLSLRKKFFLTLSAIPGIHFYAGDYSKPDIHQLPSGVNLKLISMNSLGYNGRRFFTGVNFTYTGLLMGIDEKLYGEIGYGKLSLFAGYRFKTRKS